MASSRKITADLLTSELSFTASRSSGPGGQNVNKVNSKVNLHFHAGSSLILTPEEKELIARRLSSKINRDGVLMLSAQESRSQADNKQAVLAKFDELMAKAFERKKPRRATKPSKGAVQKRIKKKKVVSEKKKWRRKPDV